MSDLEETFRQEFSNHLTTALKRIEDEWLRDHLFGGQGGELLGLLNTPGVIVKVEEK